MSAPARSEQQRFQAFGLNVESHLALPVPPGDGGSATPDLVLSAVEYGGLARRSAGRWTIREQGSFDGCPFALSDNPGGDLLIRYGSRASFYLGAAGDHLLCEASDPADPTWQRVLLDTVLWSISLVRGFELLHASAVIHDDQLLAFGGLSGGGKTTLAAELMRRGASLFTDDILAFSAAPLIAHPGPALMNLAARGVVPPALLGRSIAEIGDEHWVEVPRGPEPPPRLPNAVILVERRAGLGLECRRSAATNLYLLPHTARFPHLSGRSRTSFDLFAELAERVPVYHLQADPSSSPADLADCVIEGLAKWRDGRKATAVRGGHRSRAFGLDVDSDIPLSAGPTRGHGEPTRIRLHDSAAAPSWPSLSSRLFARRFDDGELEFTVDAALGVGYRICVSGYGCCVVSPDGRMITSLSGGDDIAMRERFLVAQALPLAAALRGFEPLHAGAVAIDDRAFAIAGKRGTGKTTTILRMIAAGAEFLTDDVLCLEAGDEHVLAHPGALFASLDPNDRDSLAIGRRLGTIVGRSDKVHLRLPSSVRALPLRGVYVLERNEDSGAPPAILPSDDREDRALLFENAFLPYLRTPARLSQQISVFAAVSRAVQCHRVAVPDGDRDAVAAAILAHARGGSSAAPSTTPSQTRVE